MINPRLLIGISSICAFITLTASMQWVRIPVLSVGFSSGIVYLLQAGDPRKRLKELDLRIDSIEKSIERKQQELQELNQLTDTELTAIIQEKELHITNLDKQIEDLNSLIDEAFEEIETKEQQSRSLIDRERESRSSQLKAEIDQYRTQQLAELESKEAQLAEIAKSDERWLQEETEKLTTQLEADKEEFLRKHRQEIAKLCSSIDLLEEELAAAHRLLEKYEEPELPRGMDVEKVAAYKVQKFFRDKGIITYLVGAYPDEANRRVLIRLRPKTGGQSQFKKALLNELQIQEDLPEPVGIRTVAGAVEFEIKPRTWTAFKPWDDLPPEPGTPEPTRPGVTSSYEFEHSSPVSEKELEDFTEPTFRLRPFGKITRVEQTWIVALWEVGIKTQRVVLGTVYMSQTGNPVAKGDGNSFIQARERMYSILDIQGVSYMRRGA